MSDSMINMKILRKFGGELEHAIRRRCVETFSSEDYIDSMEDIITRKRIGETWTGNPIESKMIPKIVKEDKIRPTKINGVQVIEEVQFTEEKEESDQDSAVSEETPVEDYSMEKITAFFEFTEVHTHLPQYSKDFYNLINIQDAILCGTKPARGKGYTFQVSCIKSILINDVEAKVNLDTGEFCTCIGKDYLQVILPEWRNHILPQEGVQFSSASNNRYPLGILDTKIVFPHPAGSMRMKAEIVVMENFTSQNIILGNDFLNIYGIDINNHKDICFTIGKNK
ncbi:hypothetical protein O181_042854 [Austropuccinia psidii MF-1]|uniref:Uncharacterized protein n=1 Tax=Austropuccinia psidii MF-1 TaxID=1389203 RepID=A0A9Q3HHV7_9BASI|nr:hypothetical protein [Austropuccinia psidii MF-1]